MGRKLTFMVALLLLALSAGARERNSDVVCVPKVEKRSDCVTYSFDRDIHVVRLNVIGDVVYRQSDRCAVKIYGGQAEMFGERMCQVVGNTLSVECNGGAVCADKVEIMAPSAGIFMLYGVGTLDLGKIENKELILRVYGNVEVKASDVDVEHFSVQYLGAGNVTMGKVKANVTDLMMSGVSEMRFKEIDGSAINVKLPGVGSVDLGTIAANLLKVSLTGVGDVKVKGKVNVANITVTGAGEVNTSGLKARKMVNYNAMTHLRRQQHLITPPYYL